MLWHPSVASHTHTHAHLPETPCHHPLKTSTPSLEESLSSFPFFIPSLDGCLIVPCVPRPNEVLALIPVLSESRGKMEQAATNPVVWKAFDDVSFREVPPELPDFLLLISAVCCFYKNLAFFFSQQFSAPLPAFLKTVDIFLSNAQH